MNRLTITQKKEALNNALRSFKFPEKYFIWPSDARLGQRFAIATGEMATGEMATGEMYSGINIHSNFMTYNEMNCYLFGFYNAINNPLK
jgi:hypothetical protein